MKHLVAGIALLIAATAAHPAGASEASAGEAREALAKATAFMRSISTEGGYLWQYSKDLKDRGGEEQATSSQIWIQPPGTPSMGGAFLRAYEVTRDERFLRAAQAAASALARSQLESGGWDYKFDFDPEKSRAWYCRTDKGRIPEAQAARRRNVSTFDDDNTQSALRFLMAFVTTTQAATGPEVLEIRQTLEYGLARMLEAQYPNGAWPQRFDGKPRDAARHPVKPASIPKEYPREYSKENYAGHYTLNDGAQFDCIYTLLDAHKRFGKPEYLAAALRGGDFLILAQLPAPQSAWAQQYNANMEPAWARAFEPPAVCAGESAGAIRCLVDLYLETGDEKYLKPIPAAIDWYERSQLAPNLWARFYELGTNRPIYGDRDGKIHYRLDEISEERRTGYSWQGSAGAGAIAYYEAVRKAGRDAYLKRRQRDDAAAKRSASSLESGVREIIASLDAEGRWLNRDRIETRLFIRNAGVLCDYLKAAQDRAP
jgi:hypothetical protein